MKRLLLISLFFVCNVWGTDEKPSDLKDLFFEKTKFDDIRLFLILDSDEEKFSSLFLEKTNSYSIKELKALYNQLGLWNKNIKPKFADSYVHIYKNAYKKARPLICLNLYKKYSSFHDNNYKVQFIYDNAFKNKIVKSKIDAFKDQLILV